MVPVDIVGKVGRAMTEIGAAGRVEVEGWAYEAMTSRAPIPAGDAVVVSGWRLVGESTYVLSVRRPGDDAPATDAVAGRSTAEGANTAPPPQYPPGNHEQRIRNLEQQLAEHQRHQAGALVTISGGAAASTALVLFLSCIMYEGPGLIIRPLVFVVWALAGAVIGIIVHLARPRSEQALIRFEMPDSARVGTLPDMNDETAFLDAIEAQSQDPTARLVYADWLDERGRALEGALQRVLAEPERDDHRLAYAVVCEAEADRLERVSPTPSESDFRQPATMLRARARVVQNQIELAGIFPPRKLYPILIEFPLSCPFAAGTRRSGVLVSQHGRAVLRRTEELVRTLPNKGDVIDLIGSDPEGNYSCYRELLGAVVIDVNHNTQRAEIEVTFSRREDHFAERDHHRWLQDMAFHALAFNGLYWVPELAPEQEHVESVPEDGRFDVLHIDGLHASARFVRGFVEELIVPADVWLTRGDSILAAHPVRAVQLTDEVRWRVDAGRLVLHNPDKPLAGRTCTRVGSNFRQWSRQSRISRALQAEWPGIAFKFLQSRS